MDERRVEYTPLTFIEAAPRNPKRHAGDAIKKSIDRFGFAELPLIDERTGRLVAGHGRLDQLAAMRKDGQAPPDGVRVDDAGEWLVPVVRGWQSRSDADAEAYLVASNRLTTLGGWDNEELGQLLSDLRDIDPDLLAVTGYNPDDLDTLLNEAGVEELPPALNDPDAVPDAPAQPRSAPGDLWILGPHRLLCGDSTNPDDVDRVLADVGAPGIVYTDPPYGISIVSGGKVGGGGAFGGKKNEKADGSNIIASSDYIPVAGDASPEAAADAFRHIHTAYPAARHVWWGGNHYAASAGLPDASCWLVWDKENTGNFADAELAWTNHPGAVRLLRHMWNGMLRASERGKRVHPTQKPVALAEWAFTVVDPDNSRRTVLDVFGGSGSTLIAAHTTGRAAAVIEMEPAYVDVMIQRWMDASGQGAHRSDGTPWNEA